jgi:chemotaxis protein histidine kinase CheA
MGLSDDEAKEFVTELIPQLEEQIPLIEEALNIPDFHQMERLTHSIKGSATNIGTGGVSDLLVACNTYLKEGTDIDIAKAYFKHLVHYTNELKTQYT